MSRRTGTLTGLVALPASVIGGFVAVVVLITGAPDPAGSGACGAGGNAGPAVVVDVGNLPSAAVAGYQGVQLANAAAIINAGQQLGLDLHAQRLGVMVAMGESQLTVLNYGDKAGPDSRGLFQQRDNGAWGTYADRMNPTTSATNFYRALVRVAGWHLLPPTLAAHETQGNADPFYYVPYWPRAVHVVTALADVQVHVQPIASTTPSSTSTTTLTSPSPTPTGTIAPLTLADPCAPGPGVPVAAGGWTKPASGPITSPFSPARVNPVTGILRPHTGDDIGAPCDAAIYAVHDGIVVQAGPMGGYGNLITLDHGGGLTTRYAHMYPAGILAPVGEQVTAGQQIARVGAAGTATACHLHFEVQQAGTFTDPAPFMAAHGAPLG